MVSKWPLRSRELLLPAHGFPIEGVERIRRVLDETAGALEALVYATLEMMNSGERLDTILHEVSLPAELLEIPMDDDLDSNHSETEDARSDLEYEWEELDAASPSSEAR